MGLRSAKNIFALVLQGALRVSVQLHASKTHCPMCQVLAFKRGSPCVSRGVIAELPISDEIRKVDLLQYARELENGSLFL